MNPLDQLIALDAAEKARLGVEATPAEIAQQPEMWRDTARRFAAAAVAAMCNPRPAIPVAWPLPEAKCLFLGVGCPAT